MEFPGCRWMHGGFVSEFLKLRERILETSCACDPPDTEGAEGGDPSLLFTGHSLGGAMAVVARQYFWERGRVISFGAPQVWDEGEDALQCITPGKRIYHESDPVPGNLFGFNAGYWHSAGGGDGAPAARQRRARNLQDAIPTPVPTPEEVMDVEAVEADGAWEIYCVQWEWSWWWWAWSCRGDHWAIHTTGCTANTGTFGISFSHHSMDPPGHYYGLPEHVEST